jgi:hypothetical protein
MGFLDIGNLLKQYLGATPAQSSPEVDQHFQQAAQVAPHEALSHGLAEAFRSDQTPPFGQMLAQLFAQSSPQQQAAILTQLFSTLGPGVLSSLAAAGGAGNLAALSAGGQSQVTPQQATQVSPQAVQQLASQAEQTNPSIIDVMSSFYAQHPGLVKTLGGGALTLIMAKMAERLNVMPFDFVRNVGNKIFHRDDEAAQKIREHIEENNPGISNLGFV